MPPSRPSEQPLRIGVIGAGGVGGTVAGRLAALDDVAVTVCVRRPIEELTIERDGITARADVEIATTPDEVEPVDWLLVATKAYSVDSAASWLRALGSDRTAVAVLQNGVEHEQRIRPYVSGPVVPVIVRFAAERIASGKIRQTGDGTLSVPATTLGNEFASLCRRAGFNTTVDADFSTSLWTKLAYNITGNTLTTITDLPVRQLALHAGMRSLVDDLIEECRTVAAFAGANLDPQLADNALDLFASYTDATLSSMHQDRRRGRPLETDALTGALIRAARHHAVPVPHTTTIDALLRALDPSTQTTKAVA